MKFIGFCLIFVIIITIALGYSSGQKERAWRKWASQNCQVVEHIDATFWDDAKLVYSCNNGVKYTKYE